MPSGALNIPIGQIEFLGQVLYIVEHGGRVVAACTDEQGVPVEALAVARVDSRACRELMREAIDLLFDAAEASLALTAYSAGNGTATRRRHRVNGEPPPSLPHPPAKQDQAPRPH